MNSEPQPAVIEDRIRQLLNEEIVVIAKLNAFMAISMEIIQRYSADAEKLKDARLALEDVRIAADEQKYRDAK